MTNRRFFLLGAAAVLATPAIVRAESLMRIAAPRLIVPESDQVLGYQMVNADHAALVADIQAIQERIIAEFVYDLSESAMDMLVYGTSFTRTNADGIPHHVPFLEAVRLTA